MSEPVFTFFFYSVAIDEAMPAQIAQYELEFQGYVTSIASQVSSDKVSLHTPTAIFQVGWAGEPIRNTENFNTHFKQIRNLFNNLFAHVIFTP